MLQVLAPIRQRPLQRHRRLTRSTCRELRFQGIPYLLSLRRRSTPILNTPIITCRCSFRLSTRLPHLLLARGRKFHPCLHLWRLPPAWHMRLTRVSSYSAKALILAPLVCRQTIKHITHQINSTHQSSCRLRIFLHTATARTVQSEACPPCWFLRHKERCISHTPLETSRCNISPWDGHTRSVSRVTFHAFPRLGLARPSLRQIHKSSKLPRLNIMPPVSGSTIIIARTTHDLLGVVRSLLTLSSFPRHVCCLCCVQAC